MMSKTAAMTAAQAACGSIIRRSRTDYICMVPWRDEQPTGPSTEIQAGSYWKLRAMRAVRIATVALHLMGREDAVEDAQYVAYQYGIGDAREIVRSALAD